MLYATDGLVIRENAVGEHDKLLTLLTPSEGQITVSAKGACSARSRLSGACKLFTYGNYEIYKKGEYRYIKDASVIEPFFGLSSDIEKMSAAAYFCEIACDITGEGVPSVDILRMTLNSFYALSKGIRSTALIKAVYEIRAAGYSGFMPEIDACALCGEKNPAYPMLDVMNGRLVCSECKKKIENLRSRELDISDDPAERGIYCRLTPSSLAALRFALTALPTRMFSFDLTDEKELSLFSAASEAYLLNHLERDFATLKFYKSLF